MLKAFRLKGEGFGPGTWKIKVSEAEVSAAGAEENLRKAVRSTYYGIRQLEENYAGLEQKLAAAEENLRVTRIKYEVGMATKQEVFSAEAALAGIKKSLLDTVCQHEVLKLAFKKPWAYAGTAGAGSQIASLGGMIRDVVSATGQIYRDQHFPENRIITTSFRKIADIMGNWSSGKGVFPGDYPCSIKMIFPAKQLAEIPPTPLPTSSPPGKL